MSAMVQVKPEPQPKRKKMQKGQQNEEPGMLSMVGAALGVCSRPLTASEKAKRVEEICKYTGEQASQATRLLELSAYDVPAAMKLWAGWQGAISLSDSDDDTETQNENTKPNGQKKKKKKAIESASDVAHTMNASSYGRIIKMIKRIESLSTATKLELPRIVVIGSESSGKSSTIERIAGFSLFPRDTNICTRMPIVLRLINAEDSARDATTVTLKFPQRSDVVVNEKEAAKAVGDLMAELVPSGKGVLEEPLTIEIRKKSVPTLELVDLPGIVAASIEGEPADMMQRTRNISDRYLRHENTIVVAVVPANITRVRDSQAMQLVQANKKEGVTLGVLAKADLAHDPRFKQRKQSTPYWELEKRLAGEADDVISLPNGWVAVKNRDTLVEEEEAGSLSQSLQAEREWFKDEAKVAKEMREEQCGIDALLKKIDGLFTKHFQSTWVPKAITHIEKETAAVAKEIDALGPSPASLSLENVLEAFVAEFILPKSMSSLSAELHSAVASIVEARKHLLRERAPAEKFMPDSADNRLPTMYDVMAKMEAEAEIVEGASNQNAVDMYINTVKRAVQQCFLAASTPMRLSRFEVLRDAVTEAIGSLMQSRVKDFAAQLSKVVEEHFRTRLGRVYGWSEADGLVRAMYETVVRELVLAPLAIDPAQIKNIVLKHFGVNNASTAGGRKRGRDVSDDDPTDQSPASSAALNALVESCADERAKLAKRKHDFFTALNELKQL